MQQNVIIPVVDLEGCKHYAYIPEDPKHPGYNSRWTLCGEEAGRMEATERLEELWQLVHRGAGTLEAMVQYSNFDSTRKVATYLLSVFDKVKPHLVYHKRMCNQCTELLDEET